MVVAVTAVRVRLRNDRWQQEQVEEFTEVSVDTELADLFAYARCWAADAARRDDADLTFSALLAAMVAGDQPLSCWLRGYFDRLAVPSNDITKHRRYEHPPLYPTSGVADQHLLTTISFRTAFALASELRDEISVGLPVGVRHFMAAYAVVPNYHLPDFRRYRIDRREWCLSLADGLANRYTDEAAGWALYGERAPDLLPMSFANDTPDGSDRLHLEREVSAFARLIASRSTATPLSIGVFGAWGSGKSFFMRRTRRRVDELAAKAADNPRESAFYARIAQVEFNAWHYSEANLIASLVDHVLRNLRIGGVDEDEAAVKLRAAEIMALLDEAKRGLGSAESAEAVAAERVSAAGDALQRAQKELPETVRKAHLALSDAEIAEQKVREELERAGRKRDEQIEQARRVAAGVVLVGQIGDEATKSAVQDAADALLGLIGSGREIHAQRRRILLGAALAGTAAAVAALAATAAWGRAVAAVTAIGVISAAATKSLGFLGQLAERGNRFEAVRDEATQAAADRVTVEHADSFAALGAQLAAAHAVTVEARTRLKSAAQATDATEALAARQAELDDARKGRVEAQRDVDALQVELNVTSIDQRLAAFIDERMANDDYHRRLGVYSQVVADFERLSKLMNQATADHFDHGGPQPTLSRIVLYIDDLVCRQVEAP